MNNIKSLEDFLNQSTGLDTLSSTNQCQSITPLTSIQHPRTPKLANTKPGLNQARISEYNHDNGNKKTSIKENVSDNCYKEFDDNFMNENDKMLKSKTEHQNPASEYCGLHSEIATSSQIEELRKFVTKSLQDIKAINKKVSSQQNQRLNNLEEKVKNKNTNLQSLSNNEKQIIRELKMELAQTNKNKTQSNQISPVEITSLKTDLLSIFSKVLSDTVESTQLMFAEQSKELNKLKEKLADKNKPPHNGKINSNNNNTDILNVFWKSLQELKEFNETEFANFNNRLFMQNTQMQTQATEIQNMSMQLEKEKKKRVTLTERFDKLLKAFNLLKKSAFDEVPTKNMIIDNEELRSTSISTGTISLMACFDSNNPKSTHGNNEKIKKEEKLKKEISATSKKKNSVSSNDQNEMLSSCRSTPSDIFTKFSPAIGTFPTASGKFPTAPGMFPTAPCKFSTAPGMFPTAPGTFPTAPGTFPTAPGTFPTAPGMFPTAPGIFPMAPGTFPTAPGIFYPPPGTWYTAPGPFSRAAGPYPIAPSSFTTNHTIFPTVPGSFSKVPGTFLKAPVIFPTAQGTLSKVSTRLSTDPGTISNAPGIFPTPPVTFSKDPGSFSEAPGKLLPSSETLSTTSEVISSSQPDISLSCSSSEMSLDNNDSNNDQFLSYLDKAQLYLKQMTSGIMNNPLNEGDSKQEDLLLYEEGSKSEEEKEIEDEKEDDLSKVVSPLETSTQSKEAVKQEERVECPLCNQIFNQSDINDHAFVCQGPVLTRNRKQKLSVRTTPSIDKDKLSVGLRLRLKLQRESGKKQKHHCSTVFFTGIPGYKVQLVAMPNLSKSVVYFFVRVFEGEHDSELSWPFNQRFCIKLASKTKSTNQVEWYIPPLHRKWKNKIDRQFQSEKVTETFGGYDMKELTDLDEVFLDVYLV